MREHGGGLPIEQFIQALTSQLDRAQSALALKASAGMKLTFAVKDISLDLRAHIEMVDAAVRITPAGPGEAEASTLHLSLTTITRPMIEENTVQMAAEPDEPSLREVLGDDTTEEEQRRLEWAGIHTVSQLREMQRRSGEQAITRIAQLPVERLRRALSRASQPFVSRVTPERVAGGAEDSPLLRIRGRNLLSEETPAVHIGGEQVRVLEASDREILVAPLAHQFGGTLVVETSPGIAARAEIDFQPPRAAAPPPVTFSDKGGEP